MRALSRRGFLGLAAGGVLVACGGGSSGSNGAGGSAKAAGVVRYFSDGSYLAGRKERLTFGLADADGVPLTDGGPEQLEAELSRQEGTALTSVGTLVAKRRADGLPKPYYAFTVDQPDPGVYAMRMSVDGTALETMFTLGAPGSLPFPGAGEAMPAFDTPTVHDPRGVDPICSRPEPCPFHAQTLTEALAGDRAVAYFIGTPAHCQTGICGPVLDLLIGAAKDFPEVSVVHADVYADDAARVLAPAVQALGLGFEPLLYLIGADGIVRQRLDVIYDTGELRDGLSGLA